MNRFCSVFSQLLKLFPRADFQTLVRQTRAERHARGFASWDQFVALLFCQLGRAHSLREISQGLRSCEGKLSHLGMRRAPSRSTLGYANEHRPAELYERVFGELFERCRAQMALRGGRKFRFKNPLRSIDSTMIELCTSLYDWARYMRTKGAVKLHLVLDHEGYLPALAVITDGHGPDISIARKLAFEPGTILILDRGYTDFGWFGELTARGVYFVTRARSNMAYAVIERLPERGAEVMRDELIHHSGNRNGKPGCPFPLRRIEVRVPDQDAPLVFLTNHLDLEAETVARVYKDRWQIELFFRALKQNLKIKSFVGTSPNAVQTQIWTALIAMLILRYLQLLARFAWSLSNLVALLRMNLFVHRDLWEWLHEPFRDPPDPPAPVQQELTLS